MDDPERRWYVKSTELVSAQALGSILCKFATSRMAEVGTRQIVLLTRSVDSSALRALSAWGLTPHYVDSLNTLQRKIVSNLLRLFVYLGEGWEQFRRIKSRAAFRVIESHGRWWALEWMRRCIKSNDHL